MERYKQSISREGSLIGFQAWNQGDSMELKNWLGFNFEKHYFVNYNGLITLFYEENEGEKFYNILTEKILKGDFFDLLVKNFVNNVNKGRKMLKKELSKEEIVEMYNLTIKCWPAVTIFDELSNYPKLVNMEALDKLLEIRKEYGEFMYESDEVILDSIVNIYPHIDGFEDVISIEEFMNGEFPKKEELEKRKKHYILHKSFLEIDKSLAQIAKENCFEIVEKYVEGMANEVKGMIAMRGKARGKVKIIFKIEEISKVEKGDILVAPMTTPDYIIAMDKAAAFVTDEGGITSHAAIIAREFGKPCIVGTENATRIFKDNDLVFVDADEGIVRII